MSKRATRLFRHIPRGNTKLRRLESCTQSRPPPQHCKLRPKLIGLIETPIHRLTRSKNNRQAGQVGYFVLNMKTLSESHVGDTFFDHKNIGTPMPGFVPAKPMVWAGIFPIDTGDFDKLDQSIAKLTLSDSSVHVQKETSNALGQGWRLGFLGTLHMDVFRQRLEQVKRRCSSERLKNVYKVLVLNRFALACLGV